MAKTKTTKWIKKWTATAKSHQSCPTLCDPIDGSPPVSSIPGILQARTLEWVAISFSNAWKWKVKGKSLSHVQLLATPWTTAYQAPPSMGFSRQEYWSGVPLPSPKKWTEKLNGHFHKKDIKVANRNKKRCSTSLIIRKMPIKTTTRYHLTLARMAIIKKTSATSDIKISDNTEYLWQWRTMGTHTRTGQSVNLSSMLESSLVESTKETHILPSSNSTVWEIDLTRRHWPECSMWHCHVKKLDTIQTSIHRRTAN